LALAIGLEKCRTRRRGEERREGVMSRQLLCLSFSPSLLVFSVLNTGKLSARHYFPPRITFRNFWNIDIFSSTVPIRKGTAPMKPMVTARHMSCVIV